MQLVHKFNSKVYLISIYDRHYILKKGERGAILKQLNHPGIPKLIKIFPRGFHPFTLEFSFMMRYYYGKILSEYLLSHRRIYKVVADLANILNYVHVRGIYHRDVKPENIIYNYRTENVMLIDWQLADCIGCTLKVGGTPYYLAPEVLQKQYFGPQNDIWALGVVFYYLFTGRMPFEGESFNELYTAIVLMKPSTHPLIPQFAKNILKQIFQPYKKRISLLELENILRNKLIIENKNAIID